MAALPYVVAGAVVRDDEEVEEVEMELRLRALEMMRSAGNPVEKTVSKEVRECTLDGWVLGVVEVAAIVSGIVTLLTI